MATMRDLDELALALPQATKEVSEDGRPAYFVHGKLFCFHRGLRRDAVDAATGELFDDVRVPRPVMPSSFWVASTKPGAALARGQGWLPWQGRGWTLAPRARGPEADMYRWTGH